MPIFSDLSLYYCGSSTSFTPSFYTNQIPSFSSPSTSYLPRAGVFSGFSGGLSLFNTPTRLLPLPSRVNKYSPLLPTISESTSLSTIPRRPLPRISSPRVVPAYRPPRPIDIDTADIDVSTPRKRTEGVSRNRDGIQQGTIKRGRTVVRLRTKRLKENPGLAQNRKKTPGEKLVEKFLIRDKPAEKVKGRKSEEEAGNLKHECRVSALREAENGHRISSGTQSDLIVVDQPKEILATKQVADEETENVVNVTQSEALDILLSETENEVTTTTPEPTPSPEHTPSIKFVSLTNKQEKPETVNKRPKNRDEECAIKRVSDNVRTPVEKSLLQRRNTLKRLRRNSRDLEAVLLDVSDHESPVPSINAGPSPMSAGSVSSAQTDSSPADSTPIISTPAVGFVSDSKDVSKSTAPKSECPNRDVCPFKTKVSDGRSERNIYKNVSVDVSVENADSIFKKMPLRFVVDEIKVEEIPKSPKSPKLFRYEVTVEEIADKEPQFQKQICQTMPLDSSSVINDVSSTLEHMHQVEGVHLSLGNSNHEHDESKGTTNNMTAIPNLSDTCSKQALEGGSKMEDRTKEFKVPKSGENTFPVEQIENVKDTINNSATIDKKGLDRKKMNQKDKTEKDICNKLSKDSSSLSAGNCSSQRSEITSPVDQKSSQSDIPAWKKALIAKSQANNNRNNENLDKMENKQKEINLLSKTQIPDPNHSVLSSNNLSKENAEIPSKQETKLPLVLPTKTCSGIVQPKSKKQQTAEKTNPENIGVTFENSTPGEVEFQSDISETGTKIKIKEIKNKTTQEDKSEEEGNKVKSFEKSATEISKCSQEDLYLHKDKLEGIELKSGQPLPAEKAKTARTKVEDIKSKFTEKTPISKTKPSESKMEETKPKFSHAEEIKSAERKIKDNKIKTLPSLPVETPPKLNVIECKAEPSTSVVSENVKTKPLSSKVTYVETSTVEEGPTTTKLSTTKPTSSIEKVAETDVKPGINETMPLSKSSVEMTQCSEIQVPSVASGSVEEGVKISDSKPEMLKSKFVETSEADKSVGTNSKLGEPPSVANETKTVAKNLPEKKLTPIKEKVLSQPKSSGTPAVEEEVPRDASTAPEVRAEPQPVEEEDETDDDDEDDDDDDGPSCSSSSSTDSAASSPALSNNPALGLDPYDDSPPSTLTWSGRVTPPATTIPRFRKYTVEDFQFLKVLGKGSFGKVLLAELKGTECYYAIKCLKKDVVLEDDDVECTLIERKVLALGTKHPYLCHLFCTFQTESHLFFVMEYLNGGDLMFHIQQSGRFPEPRARFYAAEIVSGLKFLHKKGVVYRDLKLDNILLDFDGHVRIADFGMCKLQIYLDRTADTFCGTPDYMAPEIIKGLKYNQCVDWWSFGILLYEMLIGQSPFSGCDEDDLFWSICNEQPHFPRFLSREANSILSLLLEKDSSKRLGTSECTAGDVVDQPFFRNMNWNALERRELEPPFKPRVQHPLDVQYFDKAFTAERAKLTPVEKDILQSMDQTQFQGFSYTNPNATD